MRIHLLSRLRFSYTAFFLGENYHESKFAHESLTERVCKLRKLYSSIFFNFKLFNSYYNPEILILIIVVIVFLILNVYIIFVILIDGLPSELLFSRIITTIGIGTMSYFVTDIADIVENTVSILKHLRIYKPTNCSTLL